MDAFNSGILFLRLQTPATPLFRPVHHDNILLDDFPMGSNAIVAVISYTVCISCFIYEWQDCLLNVLGL